MKRILLRGPLLSQSGYGVHARQIARWLFEKEYEYDMEITTQLFGWGVTPWITDIDAENGLVRKIVNANRHMEANPQYPNLTNKVYDVTIQLQLPNEWDTSLGNFNIGVTALVESDKCNPEWVDACNSMNLVVVPSEFTKSVLEASGKVTTPVLVIPESFPDALLNESNDPKNILDLSEVETDFNFLMIGQITSNNAELDRKNLYKTIQLMNQAFKDKKDVGLIIKTCLARQTVVDRIITENLLNQVRDAYKLEGNPKIYLLHGTLNDEELRSLYTHPKVKCLVSLTRGEGFCGLDYTPILTSEGIKRLDSIEVGEKVLTHTGNWKAVTQKLSRNYAGKMLKIIPYNSFIQPVVLTPNHNIFVYDIETKTYIWKPAEEITKKDWLCLPIPTRKREMYDINISNFIKEVSNLEIRGEYIEYTHSNKLFHKIPNKINLTKDLGRLIGYYFSEGCSSSDQILFSLNKNEKETLGKDIIKLMSSIFKIENFKFVEYEDNNKLILIFSSKILSSFFENICGKGARNKVLNNDLAFNSCKTFIDGFLTGVFLGDGHLSNREISLELGSMVGVRQIRNLLLEKKIIAASNSQRRIGSIRGSKYDNEYYRLRINNIDSYNQMIDILNNNYSEIKISYKEITNKKKGRTKFFIDGNNFIINIKSLENYEHDGIVHNLSVEDDESYCTENFVVHNCLPALEAAACGLPVMATNWSAHTEFLNKIKWLPISSNLQTIPEGKVDNKIWIKDTKWAEIINLDFITKVRKFKDASILPKQWAEEGKKTIREQYSFKAISKLYDNALLNYLI